MPRWLPEFLRGKARRTHGSSLKLPLRWTLITSDQSDQLPSDENAVAQDAGVVDENVNPAEASSADFTIFSAHSRVRRSTRSRR